MHAPEHRYGFSKQSQKESLKQSLDLIWTRASVVFFIVILTEFLDLFLFDFPYICMKFATNQSHLGKNLVVGSEAANRLCNAPCEAVRRQSGQAL